MGEEVSSEFKNVAEKVINQIDGRVELLYACEGKMSYKEFMDILRAVAKGWGLKWTG